jgi:hypothetical protein
MKTNDVFDIKRFTLLFRQNLIHHYRIILTSVIAVSGGIFIILMFSHFISQFRPWQYQQFMSTFVSLFVILGIIYTGTAFPGLRSREKSYSFLLIPSSTFEKYLFEIVNRVILFIIAFPLLYWLVFTLEGNFMRILHPGFDFHSIGFFSQHPPWESVTTAEKAWGILILVNMGLMIFLIPFTGSASFMKHPILKTILSMAVLFFFNLIIISIFMNLLGFRDHMVDNHQFLFISTKEQALVAGGIYTTLINLGLLFASYFKLKERGA